MPVVRSGLRKWCVSIDRLLCRTFQFYLSVRPRTSRQWRRWFRVAIVESRMQALSPARQWARSNPNRSWIAAPPLKVVVLRRIHGHTHDFGLAEGRTNAFGNSSDWSWAWWNNNVLTFGSINPKRMPFNNWRTYWSRIIGSHSIQHKQHSHTGSSSLEFSMSSLIMV